ncbi:hypothetical protein ABT010_18260 [Streptomyces sp. NPDC002668]
MSLTGVAMLAVLPASGGTGAGHDRHRHARLAAGLTPALARSAGA